VVSPQARYIEWKRKEEAVACLFARMLATGEPNYGQRIAIIEATAPSRIAISISNKIAGLISDPKANAAALVFPNVNTLEQLARGMLALKGRADWDVTTSALPSPPGGDIVAVAITRNIPFNGGMLPSEALVFGPFDEFPRTRRAPVTALEIYVGIPMQLDPKDGKTPSTKVNLAHIDIPSLSQLAHDRLKEMTGKRRLSSLGEINDMRAKAKVSFVMPLALATTLGCAP
jgi:hypothetical protein